MRRVGFGHFQSQRQRLARNASIGVDSAPRCSMRIRAARALRTDGSTWARYLGGLATAIACGVPFAAPGGVAARELPAADCAILGDLNSDGTFDLAQGLRSDGTLRLGTDLRLSPDGRLVYPGGIVNIAPASVPVDLDPSGLFETDTEDRVVYTVDDGLGNITSWVFAASFLQKTDPSGSVTTYQYPIEAYSNRDGPRGACHELLGTTQGETL